MITEPGLPPWEEGEHPPERDAVADKVARGRNLLLEDDDYAHLAETFRTLADPTRAKIVYSLLYQDLCTSDLAAMLGASEPAISQHLRTLRQLRVVRGRRDGKQVHYSLDDSHIRTLLSVALSHLRHNEWPAASHSHGEEGEEDGRSRIGSESRDGRPAQDG